jgi:hypothetical protein
MATPLNGGPLTSGALAALDEGLRDRSWLPGWEEHARRFAGGLTEALSTSLPTVGLQSGLAVAYAAAKSEAPLAPAAYHETWARAAVVLSLRDALRFAAESDEPGAGAQLARLCPHVVASLDAVVGRDASTERPAAEPLLTAARESLPAARDLLLGAGPGAPFVTAFFSHARRSLQLLALRDAQPTALLRAAVQRADQAARLGDGWSALPPAAKLEVSRRCVAELAGVLAEGAAQSLTRCAHESNREGKAGCLLVARAACQLLAASDQLPTWLAITAPDAPPAGANEARIEIHNNEHKVPVSGTDLAPREMNEQGKNMDLSDKSSLANHRIVKTIQADATEAAWRTAGSQLVKLTREPLVGVLSRHLGPDDPALRNKIGAFLQTDAGTAMLAAILSVGLTAMPPSAGEVPQRLAKELRIKAMTDVGELVAEVLMGPLRQVIAFYLQDMAGTVAAATPAELTEGTVREMKSSNVVPIGVAEKDAVSG